MTKSEMKFANELLEKTIEISVCEAMALCVVLAKYCGECEFAENPKKCTESCVAFGLKKRLDDMIEAKIGKSKPAAKRP